MPARAYWQGQIRLALVSIPVEIYPATKSTAAVTFRQIHEPSGKPIKYEKVVPGIGPVDTDEIMKGFEVGKGDYVLLTPDEIDAVKLESKKTLELTQFVDAGDIDVLYYEKPYFVVPADDLAEEAYIVLREALKRSRKVGLGQLAMRGREYVVSLKPCGKGMVLETLRYADEVNRAQTYFREIGGSEPDADLLDLAETLIEKKATAFDPNKFADHYTDAVKELVARKQKAKGRKITAEPDEPRPSGSNVVDLMAALKKSLEKPGSSGGRSRAKTNPAAKPAAKSTSKAAASKAAPSKTTAKKPAARKRA
ncbi:DNA end-binding protein Ku [Sphingomonas zeicaulis]|uniref:non-homologous end joining protein Ku n=1 Tax=Sphingomonas zeicaulis TaxID=1632740 RepID=UPI003D249139